MANQDLNSLEHHFPVRGICLGMRTPSQFLALNLVIMMTTLTDSLHDGTWYYDEGAKRICAWLSQHELPIPNESALREQLLDRFCAGDYLLAHALLASSDPSDWHIVLPSDDAGKATLLSYLQAASSREEALSALLAQCDQQRIFPTACEAFERGVRLMVESRMLVEIRRMEFDTVGPRDAERVKTAFKGIRSNDTAHLLAKLKHLPGFSGLAAAQLRRPASSNGFMLLPSPTSWVAAMRDLLKEMDCQVPNNVAQNLVCELFGIHNWHALVAQRDAPRVWFVPVCVTTDEADPSCARFYRSDAEGIAAFGMMLRTLGPERLVMTDVGRAATVDGAIYLEAKTLEGAQRKHSDPALLCIPVDRIEHTEDPTYLSLARTILEALDSGIQHVPLDGAEVNQGECILRANERQGISRDQTLRIGNTLISIVKGGSYRQLLIEEFDSNGAMILSGSTPLYKATLTYTQETRSLNITQDYESAEFAAIAEVSQQDIQSLLTMLWLSDDGTEARSWGRSDIRGTRTHFFV